MKKLIAPSILSANFAKLGEEVRAVEKAGADWIHVDVMDGHFVPNITIGPLVVDALSRVTTLPLDVHLMIENPLRYIEAFAKAGATGLTIHSEAVENLTSIFKTIRSFGVNVGVSINPATPVEKIKNVLKDVDVVLVMSVNPGFGGQKFIPESVDKIKKLYQLRKEYRYKFLIEVDGGVNEKNIAELARAGCDVFVAGSAIFHAKPYKTIIQKMRNKLADQY